MTDAITPDVAAITGLAFAERARSRLTFELAAGVFDGGVPPKSGDHALDGLPPNIRLKTPKSAAVLVPVIDHPSEATVLLTQRVATLRTHSGQIAFPGGRIDPDDASPLAAALREGQEEIGLDPAQVTPLGYLDPYLTGTGYLVIPAVVLVEPPLRLTLNPAEVHDAFEVPLAFLLDPRNHQRHAREFGGALRNFYAMPYAERYIWGATAGMLRSLYERLYG